MSPEAAGLPAWRWTRFVPRQFSIGAMLGLITVAACFLWWYIQLPEGHVTLAQARRVSMGMSIQEVEGLLGKSLGMQAGHGMVSLNYRVVAPDGEEEDWIFGFDGRMKLDSVSQANWSLETVIESK